MQRVILHDRDRSSYLILVMSCVDTKHLFVDGAKEWALHYFFNEFEGKRKPSWVAGHLRSINKRVFGKLTASHLRVWVSRWKKDHRGQRPGQPTEQPGGAPKKGGRQATFSDEQLRKLGNQLKAYLKVNPVGTDAPTLAPVLYGMMEDDPAMKKELLGYGGNFQLSISWAYNMIGLWGLRRRRGTNAARKLPADFDHQRLLFNMRLAYIVRTEAVRRGWPQGTRIPKSLILNWYVNDACGQEWLGVDAGVRLLPWTTFLIYL